MEGQLLRGLAAQQVSEAGDWRAAAWTETESRASSVACTPVGCTQGGERGPGLEEVVGALPTCLSSWACRGGDAPGAGARVAPWPVQLGI